MRVTSVYERGGVPLKEHPISNKIPSPKERVYPDTLFYFFQCLCGFRDFQSYFFDLKNGLHKRKYYVYFTNYFTNFFQNGCRNLKNEILCKPQYKCFFGLLYKFTLQMKPANALFIRAKRVFNLKKNLYDIFWGASGKSSKKIYKSL